MQRILIIAIALVVAAALLAFTMTLTVRFTESAVVTTFGKASAESTYVDRPGLKFKWPYPIQAVTKYDTRIRLVSTRSETQQTADNRQIVVESFCTWRVADPLLFFQRFSNAGDREEDHFRQAEVILRSNLRSAVSEVSRYSLGELFTPDEATSKLPELEQRILSALRAGAGAGDQGGALALLGIEVQEIGLSRIILPDETTKAVFAAMESERAALVTQEESRGNAEAQSITTRAQSNAERIRSFAERRAAEIRRQGDEEASQWVARMNQNPDLAVFLRNVEMLREVMTRRATLVLSTSDFGMELLNVDALGQLKPGEIPGAPKSAQAPAGGNP